MYMFAPPPDKVFYFRVPVAVSLTRKIASRQKISYYEAGMDLGLSTELVESYERFQTRLKREYEQSIARDGFTVIDADRPVEEIHADLRHEIRPLLAGFPTDARMVHVSEGELR